VTLGEDLKFGMEYEILRKGDVFEGMATGYQTSDLNLAAFLMSCGYKLLKVNRQARGRCTYAFSAEAHGDAQTFYQNATVQARIFANALRDLKALIRET